VHETLAASYRDLAQRPSSRPIQAAASVACARDTSSVLQGTWPNGHHPGPYRPLLVSHAHETLSSVLQGPGPTAIIPGSYRPLLVSRAHETLAAVPERVSLLEVLLSKSLSARTLQGKEALAKGLGEGCLYSW